MPAIKSADEIAKKWARVTPARSSDYKDGVATPKKDWAESTAAAKEAWSDGVQQAISDDRFARGVKKVGTDKWKKKALTLGVRRWSEGISEAVDDYKSGFAPFVDVIAATKLPPRYRKGDPRNIDRVATIAKALHEAKVK